MQCLLHLSTKSIDGLIPSCQKYYNEVVSIFWYSRYTEKHFYGELNECFNKIVDRKTENESVLHQLAVLCFMSPYRFIKEMLERVFKGMLKCSTVAKV